MAIPIKNLTAVCDLLGAPTVLVSLPDFAIEYCNAAAEDVFGDTQEELKGRIFAEFFNDVNGRRVRAMGELTSHFVRSTFIRESFLQLRRRAGRLIPVNVTAASIQGDERTYVLFSIEDLSEFQKLESEKEALLKEVFHVSKLADIGRLAAGMAHELNNPLTVVLGFTEDLESEIEGGNSNLAELGKLVSPILQNAQRMKKIIASMYGIARGDEPELGDVSAEQLLTSLYERFKGILAANGIQFVLHPPQPQPLTIRCDAVQIEQILTNIVSNAVQALEGTEDKKIEVSAIASGDTVQIKIWNNGPEISESAKGRIFTPFFTTKSVGDGMGLGLYLSYTIIQAHRGQMWFETDKHKGTSFFVQLSQATYQDKPKSRDKQKILLVESESFVRQVLVRKLTRMGLDCVEVKYLPQAMERILAGESFSGLLVEIRKPGDESLDSIRQLRASSPELSIGILAASLPEEFLEQLEALKVQGVIKKPISDHELDKILEQMINHHTKASRA